MKNSNVEILPTHSPRLPLPWGRVGHALGERLSGRQFLLPLLAAVLVGCAEDAVEVPERPTPRVEVFQVETKTIQPTLELTGSVVSQEIARIHPEVAGTVERVLVREGDRVVKGQILVELNPSDYEYRLQIAEAEKLKASAEYTRILRGFRPEDIQAARSAYEEARAIHRSKTQNLDRNRALYQGGSMTERDWTMFLEELAAAGAIVGRVSAELRKMEMGYEAYDVRAASAALLLAEANESLARRELQNTRIMTPIDGVVSRRDVELGQLVGPNQVVLEVQNPERIWLLAEASAKDAATVRIGQSADIYSDTLQLTQPGRIDRVAETLNPNTKSLAVWLAWEPGAELPPIGSFAKATLYLEPLADVIALQRKWVHLERGVHFVWIVREGALERREIRIGADRGDEVVVDAGIEPGDRLVVSAPTDFEEGLVVRVGSEAAGGEGADGEEGVLTLSMSGEDSPKP